VANRNNGRSRRSRKRRRSGGKAVAASGAADVQSGSADAGAEPVGLHSDAPAKRPAGKRTRSRGAAQRGGREGGFKDPQSVGERPQAPWYPLPLSELLILVGAIGTVVGLQKGVSNGGPALIAGLAAVIIGTLEVTLREHLSGYRSHTLILSLLPTILLDTALALIVAAFVTPVPVALRVAVLVLDVPLFAFLFKLLRARFKDARRERVFAGSR
jgi:hypothetical protein